MPRTEQQVRRDDSSAKNVFPAIPAGTIASGASVRDRTVLAYIATSVAAILLATVVGCTDPNDDAVEVPTASPTAVVPPTSTATPTPAENSATASPTETPVEIACVVEVEVPVGDDPCGGDPPTVGGVALEVVATGLVRPLGLTTPPGDPSRLFIIGQDGRVRIVDDGVLLAEPFLDLRGRTTPVQERGLLSLVFHPDFDANGNFFVNYTDENDDNVISRWRVSGDENRADTGSEELLLLIEQPTVIHNAGQLAFGPDGYLYIGVADGGPGGDPSFTAQDLGQLLGKILRIDVDSATPYAVPTDNPFVGIAGARPEIWSYGFRNPWRFSFDRQTGDMYIGDVGETSREEINIQPAGCGGLNFGWSVFEGTLCRPRHDCEIEGLVAPVVDFDRIGLGASITGGFVYRGCALPELRGTYFYSDFLLGFLHSFRFDDGAIVDARDWTEVLAPAGGETIGMISSFGEDSDGELYVIDIRGTVYKLVPQSRDATSE